MFSAEFLLQHRLNYRTVGHRIAAVLRDSLLDRLGPEFTLVDLSGDGSGKPLVEEANGRGPPTAYLVVDDDRTGVVWERPLVPVRPDQHVAWRGAAPPPDWPAIVDHIRGGARSDR